MALSGIRVLDLTGRAGRFAGRLLAGLGAEVLRPAEAVAATQRALGAAGRLYYEAGKSPLEGAASDGWEGLLDTVDVLLDETLAPGRAEALARRHPHLVVLRLTDFGTSGPRRDWVGSDLVCAARAGMVFVNGHPESAPLQPFGTQAYHATGIWSVIAVLHALRVRRGTGKGLWLDLSVHAAAAGAVEHVTGLRRQGREIQRRQGTLHWSRVFRAGPTRDGWILHTLAGDWQTLSLWVDDESDQPELLDSALDEVDTRRERCVELFDCLDRWGATKSAARIEEEGQLRRLTFAEMRPPERLARDPQLAARGWPGGRSEGSVLPGPPFLFSQTPFDASPQLRAPVLRKPVSAGSSGTETSYARPSATPAPRAETPARLRILDFTWVVAGPVATRIFADLGADIIKVEHPLSPDFGSRRGGLSGNLNRGKRSLVLDMDKPEALAIARRLVAESDVVIDNFSARVMQNWGLDYESLRAIKPDIVQVRLSGFGLDGPEKDRVSYGPTLQAMAGLAHLMKHADGPPAGWGYSWSDMVGGLMGAVATFAALHHRDRTGEGQLVDVGQYGNLVSLLGPGLGDLLAGRPVAPPANTSQEGGAVPHGVFRTADEARADGGAKDRWIAIAVLQDAAWAAFAAVLAADGQSWAEQEKFATLAGRCAARTELEAGVQRWTRGQAAAAVEARLQAVGVPAGLVADGDDLAEDAQLLERGYFPRVRTPEGEEEVFDGIPFLASESGGEIRAPGPLRGEHGSQILQEVLKMSATEIDALRAEGVIA
ncbi:MAG: CoA transferase [Deltaproteobacteria bacterium]